MRREVNKLVIICLINKDKRKGVFWKQNIIVNKVNHTLIADNLSDYCSRRWSHED